MIGLLYSVAGTISPFALVAVPHLTSRLRAIEALSGLVLLLLLGHAFGIAGVIAALLAEITFATGFRVAILYRFIVTENRGRHAATAALVVVAVAAPLLCWEVVAEPSGQGVLAPATIAAYFAVALLLGSAGFLMRRRMFGNLL